MEDICIVLVGNKSDCADRAVAAESVEDYAMQCGLKAYYEISAKTGENVNEVVQAMAELCAINVPVPSGHRQGAADLLLKSTEVNNSLSLGDDEEAEDESKPPAGSPSTR